MYEEDRLVRYLESHRPDDIDKLIRGIIVDVLKYMGKTNQTDDITLLSLEYYGAG